MKQQKLIIITIICSLICSIIPFFDRAQAIELTKSYFEVKEDSEFFSIEGEKAGVINKGFIIEGIKEEQDDQNVGFYINETFYLMDESLLEATQELEQASDELAELVPVGEFISSDSTYIYSELGNEQSSVIGTLVPNQTYTYTKDNTGYFELKLGGVIVFVKKDEVQTYTINQEEEPASSITENTENEANGSSTPEQPNIVEEEKQAIEVLEETDRVNEEEVDAMTVNESTDATVLSAFSKNDRYFEVINTTPIYLKKNNKLVRVGRLTIGEEYPRIRDYGENWHEVKFSNTVAYVKKEDTKPSNGADIKNLINGEKSSTRNVIAKQNIAVYDNSSGELVPYASIYENVNYHIISDYGSWYKISILDRVGFIRKSDVTESFSSAIKYFKVTDATAMYIKQNDKLVRVGRLSVGEVYPRVRDYGANWHEIKFGNSVAYVEKRYTEPSDGNQVKNQITNYKNSSITFRPKENIAVYENRNGKLIPFAGIYTNASYPVLSDYGSWFKVVVANRLGYVRKKDIDVEFSSNMKLLQATVNTAIYIKKGGNLISVGFVKEGHVVERIREYGANWHEIEYGNGVAYIRKQFTSPSTIKIVNKSAGEVNTKTSFKTKINSAVYHNDSGKLVPFASINANETYPIVSDYGTWYKIKISGRVGYISKEHVTVLRNDLVNPVQTYSYKEMEQDIFSLNAMYPSIVDIKTIGKSVDGRNIYALKLGTGKTEVLFNGSHHAREHMTTNLLMEMIDEYAQGYVGSKAIDGYNVKQILTNTSIWFVPMVNPDGVTLVQEGYKSAKNPSYVLKINNNNKDFSAWKANIRGVDLNRQYPADWNNICCNPGKPGPQNYKGEKPLSEPEVRAMYNFTLDHSFKTAVSYHSSGEIIYWHFHQKSSDYSRDYKLAEKLSDKTGYNLVAPKSNPSGGGFTDWFLINQRQPGFTPEISPYVGTRPVPLKNFESIWKENHSVGLLMADEAYKRTK
ncbi:M14 family metallocarboxypeptidase [Metabacillus bambusae]|uniref:M14 family metallocarboxypeptidase n=1 Tax=Metabacillus bambusae TaxID=2795218 RepID=A0ABS3N1G1_9BACI|nr:M14 family metallocarboxypeptidase [Metabacillus bambusae]MBO1511763.1 M14 family metallocarboxypeptidase [Metabacillus bambusae]